MKKINLAFYIPLDHLKIDSFATLLNTDTALSGTDSQIINRAISLRKHFRTSIYSNTPLKEIPDDIDYFNFDNKSALVRNLVESKCDILVLNNRNDTSTLELIQLAEYYKIKSILWHQNGPYPNYFKLLDDAEYVKRVLCVSRSQANYHRHKNIFNKTTFIYNSIKTEEYEFLEDSKQVTNVCYIGSLTPSKGFQHLARIWPQIHKQFPHLKLLVVGSGKLYNNFNQLGELGIAEKNYEEEIKKYLGHSLDEIKKNGVEFLGLLPPHKIKSILKKVQIGIVNPNVSGSLETFCVSAIELQAMGIPTLGARKLGLKETIGDRKTGLLHSSYDEFRHNLIKIISNDKLRASLAANCRSFIEEKFEDKILIKQWVLLINNVYQDLPNITLGLNRQDLQLKTILKEIFRRTNVLLH